MKRVWPCLFGLRCGRIYATAATSNALPEGYKVVADYVCGGCGTRYRGNGWRRQRVKA